jgi:hypothetical protein
MQLDAEVKARIPAPWLTAIEDEAQREGLKVSDIIRRALRTFLGRKAQIPRKAK